MYTIPGPDDGRDFAGDDDYSGGKGKQGETTKACSFSSVEARTSNDTTLGGRKTPQSNTSMHRTKPHRRPWHGDGEARRFPTESHGNKVEKRGNGAEAHQHNEGRLKGVGRGLTATG